MTTVTSSNAAPLHLSELCKQGNIESVLQRLRVLSTDEGNAINYADDDGRTAFHWCVGLRCWDLAELLMNPPHSCVVDTKDKDGMTPLMSACATDAPAPLISILIERSLSDLEAVDSAGNTALILAASKGNLSALKKLVAAGASIAHQNKRGQTALHRAVSRGQTDVVEEIIATLKKMEKSTRIRILNLVDCEGNTPLHYAAMENNQELGQLLLRNGAVRDLQNKQGKQFWEL